MSNNIEKSVSSRVSREKGTNKTYSSILERNGPLNKNNKVFSRDVFALAMAYGYENDLKLPIETRDNFINKENLGKNLPSLINSLAITNSSLGVEILAENPSDIYDVAEQYANGGLDILEANYIGEEDEFIDKLRLKLLKLNKNNKIIDKLKELEELNMI